LKIFKGLQLLLLYQGTFLKTTGFASMRITVVLAGLAHGEKVTPLIILKGKDSDVEKKYGKPKLGLINVF